MLSAAVVVGAFTDKSLQKLDLSDRASPKLIKSLIKHYL